MAVLVFTVEKKRNENLLIMRYSFHIHKLKRKLKKIQTIKNTQMHKKRKNKA